ncbi:unnamed protein product [Eruca vesicaria subsp. sativa]|uniref:Uncharacterized protein n=1 Tax=Eruca vesicaria subsp. sativa TaxID=29727 RepID=A0ABC8KDV7_ERUVS|nr:unnamed protein product [Eruca vesicaria subsp. sativa]
MGRRITEKEFQERHKLMLVKYFETLRQSEGFDVSSGPQWANPLKVFHCADGCCDLALLYARMGLHRYNLLQGTKLQLSRVKKYNRTRMCPIQSYYMTLEAEDDCGSLQTFQTKISEKEYRTFNLECTVARLLGEKTITVDGGDEDDEDDPKLPELPRENPFVEDGTNRFRLLKDSELEDNDWIRLYLDLAVATTNRSLAVIKESLTNLKILKVATESSQGLGDYDAVFYIEYEDSCEPRVGKDVHRVAIVRRFLDKQSQVLCLSGHNQSINKIASMEAGSSSALD